MMNAIDVIGVAVAATVALLAGCRSQAKISTDEEKALLMCSKIRAVAGERAQAGDTGTSFREFLSDLWHDERISAVDPWGTGFRMWRGAAPPPQGPHYLPSESRVAVETLVVGSAGPDRRWGTNDDVFLPDHSRSRASPKFVRALTECHRRFRKVRKWAETKADRENDGVKDIARACPLPVDPWGRRYEYTWPQVRSLGNSVELPRRYQQLIGAVAFIQVVSRGPDGVLGSSDDIFVPLSHD